jgi:hypothetical protein
MECLNRVSPSGAVHPRALLHPAHRARAATTNDHALRRLVLLRPDRHHRLHVSRAAPPKGWPDKRPRRARLPAAIATKPAVDIGRSSFHEES